MCWCDLRAQVSSSSSSSWPSPPDLTPAPPLLTLPYTQHHILTAVSWQYSPVSNHQSDKYGELLKILPYLSFFIHSTYGLSSPNCSNLKCLFDFLQNTCKNLPSCRGYCRSSGLIVQVNNWRFVSQHMMARSHNTQRSCWYCSTVFAALSVHFELVSSETWQMQHQQHFNNFSHLHANIKQRILLTLICSAVPVEFYCSDSCVFMSVLFKDILKSEILRNLTQIFPEIILWIFY